MATRRTAEKAAPAVAKPDAPKAKACANCDEPATVLTGGRSADRLGFCKHHAPANLR